MFSKSSNIAMPNEYLCDETCGNQEGYGTSPFCATMGQPLIYYCQMPQQMFRQRNRNARNDNRNCFTKAFQWYTEEHVPHRNEPAKKSGDVKGFANWLDSKYEQFLQDQCDSCGYKVKHTSITEAYKIQNESCETRRKKFRVKSPWRKKRGHKETGDVTSKCSLHYILKPKDISRPASETNEMSKSMMMSSEVVLSRYSHSCTSFRVRPEPSVTVVEKRSQEATHSLTSIKPKKDATKSLSKMYPEKTQDVKCLCSTVTKRNAYTQSDPWPVKSPSKSAPKSETTSQIVPKSETPSPLPQTEQKASPCLCCCSKFPKISHPRKIEIEFEAKPSLSLELRKCLCSKELIPKADAQCQIQTDVMTFACGSDHSMSQEKSQIMPKKVRLCPCEYLYKDYEKCPLEPPLTNTNQNQPLLCSQCIPCKRTTIVTEEGQISNRSNKTTPGANRLASNPSNKKTTGCDGILSANPTKTNDGVQTSNQTTIANDGVQTSNQTTIANDGVQTSNHSLLIEKDGAAAAYPLFMKIVFADKLCKF